MARPLPQLKGKASNPRFSTYNIYTHVDEEFFTARENNFKTPALLKQISAFDNALCVWKYRRTGFLYLCK